MQETIDPREIAWIIADTETTGLTGPACEIAFREIDPDTLETLDELDELIDPECEIEPGAEAIHGISQAMVADAPTLSEFIRYYMGDRFEGRQVVVIAHNASFDIPRLCTIADITSSICTMQQARNMFPRQSGATPDGPENHKLGTLREYFGFPKNEAHRALADVATTHRLLREILGRTERTLRDFHATQDVTVHRMPFGKHCGMLMMDLPPGYLQWLWNIDIDANLRKSVDKAMKAMGIMKIKAAA